MVALSSTEAEYVMLSLAAQEITWLRLLFIKLGLLIPSKQFVKIYVYENNKCAKEIFLIYVEDPAKPVPDELTSKKIPIIIKWDNQSSISLANNPVLYMQTKHINIQHHYIRNEVASGRIHLIYTQTEEMLVDRLTKPLSHVKFLSFIRQMQIE